MREIAGRTRRKRRSSEASKPNELVGKLKSGQTREAASAALAFEGLASNTAAARQWQKFLFGDLHATDCQNAMVDMADRVNAGDLSDAEAMLVAQAVALNAVFTNLILRAKQASRMDTVDQSLRFAFRAQGQCRATLEVRGGPPAGDHRADGC